MALAEREVPMVWVKEQLMPAIRGAQESADEFGTSLCTIILTDSELEWLLKLAQDGDGKVRGDACAVVCIDYLSLRRTCPINQEFYGNDLLGLLNGATAAAHATQVIVAKAKGEGWGVIPLLNIFPKIAALQKRLNLPSLVLPVSVIIFSKDKVTPPLAKKNYGCHSVHMANYDETNISTTQTLSWWQNKNQTWNYGRAARYLALNQLYEALDSFGLVLRGVIKSDSTGSHAKENISQALYTVAQKYRRSVFSLQKMRLDRARRIFIKGNTSRAQHLAQRVAIAEKGALDALAMVAIFQWGEGKLESAVDTLGKIRKLEHDGFVNYLLGQIYNEQGLSDQAISCLKKSVQLDPKFAPAWLVLAKATEESRGPQAAIEVFNRARQALLFDAALLNNEGLCYSELGQDEQALDSFKQALAFAPNDPTILANKGLILGRQGKIESALACYERALKIDPNNAYLLNNKGFCLGKLEYYTEALRCYEKALLNQEPSDTSLLHNKATCLNKLGRHKEALACYDKVLEFNPADTTTLNNRGLCLLNLGRIREAIACYDMAIALQPKNAVLWGNKGASLFKQGKYEDSLAAYETALQLAPDELAYYSGKGMCLDYLGRSEEAVVCYNRALSLV